MRLVLLLAFIMTAGFSSPAFADVADGSDGADGEDGDDGDDGDDTSDEDDDKGCSHVAKLATPATGLSLMVGTALLVGLRRRD